MKARTLSLALIIIIIDGCSTLQTRKPNVIISLNLSLESQIDPMNKTKIEIQIGNINTKTGD